MGIRKLSNYDRHHLFEKIKEINKTVSLSDEKVQDLLNLIENTIEDKIRMEGGESKEGRD